MTRVDSHDRERTYDRHESGKFSAREILYRVIALAFLIAVIGAVFYIVEASPVLYEPGYLPDLQHASFDM